MQGNGKMSSRNRNRDAIFIATVMVIVATNETVRHVVPSLLHHNDFSIRMSLRLYYGFESASSS